MNAVSHIAAGSVLASCALAQDAPAEPRAVPIGELVKAAVAKVDAARVEKTIRALAAFGTRHVLSATDNDAAGTGAARTWLRAQFDAIAAGSGGRLTVALQSETVPCTRRGFPKEVAIVNVLATLRGTTDPDRVYVIGGHYDSRNATETDGVAAAPGAVDDASGTAVALEACRVLSACELPATIVFAAYDAEELGLLGSAAHAKSLAAKEAKVDGMITCDIVGNTLGMDGERYDQHLRCFSYAPSGNDSNGRSLARAVAYAARTHVSGFGVKLIFRGDRYGRGGDHRSFMDQGWPAVRFSEPREDFSRQHQNVGSRHDAPYGDLPEFCDFAFTANVAKVVVATLAELASAPPAPRVLSAQLRRDRYDTEITYELPAGAPACEFVWRETTEPDWTHVVAMADASPAETRGGRLRATLRGVCLDDVVVGVRTVAPNGARSRVATPPEPDRVDQRARGQQTPDNGEPGSGK